MAQSLAVNSLQLNSVFDYFAAKYEYASFKACEIFTIIQTKDNNCHKLLQIYLFADHHAINQTLYKPLYFNDIFLFSLPPRTYPIT